MELTESSTGMNFTENQHGSAILEKLRGQKETARFCDVIFHLEDKQYHAHRNILAACSPYFESMLKMKEGVEHMNVNCNPFVFEVLLNYVYTGKVVIDDLNVQELLQMSNQFMINKLKGYCSEYLERSMHMKNIFRIKEIAEKCGLPQLAKTADAYIYANVIEIINEEEILKFSPARLDNLLANKSMPLTEDVRLHMICRWIKNDVANRQFSIQGMLSHIHWERINIQTLYNILGTDNGIFHTNDWCMYQILSVLDDRKLLFEIYRDKYDHLRETFKRSGYMSLSVSTVERVLQAAIDSQQPSKTSEPTDTALIDPRNEPLGTFSGEHDHGGEMNVRTFDHTDFSEEIVSAKVQNVSPESDKKTTLDDPPSTNRNKRKGSPIKVRIPKSKIKLETKIPKKRGRSTKAGNAKSVKPKNVTQSKQTVSSATGDSGGSDGEVDDKNSSDDDYVPDICYKSSDDDPDKDADERPDACMKKTTSSPRAKTKKKKGSNGRPRKSPSRDKVTCPKCYYSASEEKMEKHMKKAHRTEITFECNVCDFKSNWSKEYHNHMKEHYEGPPYKCEFPSCGHTTDRIQLLLLHRMKHTDERPYVCTVCNMKFRNKNNLTTHIRIHTGEKPFECEVCKKRFATKGTLEQHVVTHSDHRPYLCDTCGFSTKYQSHLIAHRRIHTGDVFRCQYPNCKYFTPKRSQLACHMRSHMDIRQHICSVCGRGFVEKSHLVRHERIHLDEKPFQCDQCEYSSTRRDKLKEHVIKYHGEGASAKVPYKPRKPRKQAPNPQAFPALSQLQSPKDASDPDKQDDNQPRDDPCKSPTACVRHEQNYQYLVTSADGTPSQNPPMNETNNALTQVLQTSPNVPSETIVDGATQSTVDARSIGLMIDPRTINISPIGPQPLNLVQPVTTRAEAPTTTQGYQMGQTSTQQEYNNVSNFMGIFN